MIVEQYPFNTPVKQFSSSPDSVSVKQTIELRGYIRFLARKQALFMILIKMSYV